MPTTGCVTIDVEAADEAAALDAFYDEWARLVGTAAIEAHRWEFTQHVTRGNVCSAMVNDYSVELVPQSGRGDERGTGL